MNQLKIIIEKSDNYFSAYAENAAGIYGMGKTAKEAKTEALKGIKLLVENNDKKHIPDVLKGKYKIVYKFDTQSFLNYYKGIFTNAGIERITGINQKQVQHYSSGSKKPRQKQREKIEQSLHKLGEELLNLEL